MGQSHSTGRQTGLYLKLKHYMSGQWGPLYNKKMLKPLNRLSIRYNIPIQFVIHQQAGYFEPKLIYKRLISPVAGYIYMIDLSLEAKLVSLNICGL